MHRCVKPADKASLLQMKGLCAVLLLCDVFSGQCAVLLLRDVFSGQCAVLLLCDVFSDLT